MKSETKLFLGILVGTIAIVIAGIFLLTKPAGTSKVDNLLLVREDSQKIASGSGRVTLVEFSDFQCPACGAYHPVVKGVIDTFKDDLTFVYRNYPLESLHKNARLAAQAAESAGLQGKYWEMSDMLFSAQKDWSNVDNAKEMFIGYAKTLNLNTEQFAKDIDSDSIKKKIQRDIDDGDVLGISGTPSFFVNGEKIANPATKEAFESIIKAAIEKSPVPTKSEESAYHTHFNFAARINGIKIDFSESQYQEKHEFIHFHDNVGDVVHIHKEHSNMGEFLTSLGITQATQISMYVNGTAIALIDSYEPKDLDKILVTDGPVIAVSDTACIYSETCPQRGTPPTEKCVGGLGTDCEE